MSGLREVFAGVTHLFRPKTETIVVTIPEPKHDPIQQLTEQITQQLNNSLKDIEARRANGEEVGFKDKFNIPTGQMSDVISHFADGDGFWAEGSTVVIFRTKHNTVVGDPVYLWVDYREIFLTTDPLFIGQGVDIISIPLERYIS